MRRLKGPLLLLLWSLGPRAQAHWFWAGDEDSIWSFDPIVFSLLLMTAGIYWLGNRTLMRKPGAEHAARKRRKKCFWLGWSSLTLALSPPIDPLGEKLFSVHMVQHEIIMLLSAPLLVMSRPGSAFLSGLGKPFARKVGVLIRNGRGLWRLLFQPLTAWTLHAFGLWAWHLPSWFEASLRSASVHTVQHISFLMMGLIFWYALIRARRRDAMLGVIYLFTTALHAGLLGALLTFSPDIWYPTYGDRALEWGITPLADQQLGGLIMWMPAGLVFIAGGLWSLSRVFPSHEPDFSAATAGNDGGTGKARTIPPPR